MYAESYLPLRQCYGGILSPEIAFFYVNDHQYHAQALQMIHPDSVIQINSRAGNRVSSP